MNEIMLLHFKGRSGIKKYFLIKISEAFGAKEGFQKYLTFLMD
jgi:hypothetical protein